MLFNSYPFLLLFLPLAFVGFFTLGRFTQRSAALWLGFMSLVFYSWWDPRYTPLLLASICTNYFLGNRILNAGPKSAPGKRWLTASIVLNLIVLAYFKYAMFFLTNIAEMFKTSSPAFIIILPLGISFFTFTQIAYLVDTYQGKVQERSFIHYLLFVTYFPHLIAGPVLHHAEMMPQFRDPKTYRPQLSWITTGFIVFAVGMFKKVVLADGIQVFVGPVFDTPPPHQNLSIFEAWGGALCYTFQLYFDFSGYCDMAIGLSRMFNIELPQNFNSPYKAFSIIDFWRRWHMTLSRFLRDYLYIPLGGNRNGEFRRYLNLFITMFLGGLWHGAGWTFVVWGTLHGIYLFINHMWRDRVVKANERLWSHIGWRPASWAITFGLVVMAWVFFRALTFGSAFNILRSMAGVDSLMAPPEWQYGPMGPFLGQMGFTFVKLPRIDHQMVQWILVSFICALAFPNVQQIVTSRWYVNGMEADEKRVGRPVSWFAIGFFLVATLLLLIITESNKSSEFIYFNF